jgi:subtilisin family serine protease
VPKKTLFHVLDLTLLESLEEHEDTFSILPFALGVEDNFSAFEECERVIRFKKDSFYVQLIQGIDWLVGIQNVDVLNLSLGLRHGVFEENEPIHIATKVAFDAKTIVVTAAGNRGPSDDTLQAIARAPWVISVVATDKSKRLLDHSARGVPDVIGPTLVTNGESDYVAANPGKPVRFLDDRKL